MPRRAEQFIPWSQRQLMPSQLELRKQAAEWIRKLAVSIPYQFVAIPIPRAAGVQWFYHEPRYLQGTKLCSCTPAIHALLTGRQLHSARVGGNGGWDNWHSGIAMQADLNFRDPNLAEWLAEELKQCARTVSVGLYCNVQVLRLDGPSNQAN